MLLSRFSGLAASRSRLAHYDIQRRIQAAQAHPLRLFYQVIRFGLGAILGSRRQVTRRSGSRLGFLLAAMVFNLSI